MAGAFAGVWLSGFLTNARSADQLSGPFGTTTFNVGVACTNSALLLRRAAESGISPLVRLLRASVLAYLLAV